MENQWACTDLAWNAKALTATGYREFIRYIDGEISKDEATKLWKISEKKYIKRQLTWFKRQENIEWFDVLDPKHQKKVEKLVETWENKT